MNPFLKDVAIDLKDRFGESLHETAIIFNNKRPITYLKQHLADVYGQAIWSPQFFTIQEFFRLSTNLSEATPIAQFFMLYHLHNGLLAKEGIEAETLEEFYPIAETILSDFAQLDYDLVNIDEIFMELFDNTQIDLQFQHFTTEQQEFIRQFWQSFSISEHSAVQERFLKLWRRLPVLYRAFKEELKAKKMTNVSTFYREIVEEKSKNQTFHKNYKQIIFVGFNALNRAEAILFKKWQEEGLALFYFDADAYYLDDKQQEAGLFIRRNIQQTGLKNALGDSPNVIGNRHTEVNLYAATGNVSQTKLLHDILVNHEKDGQSSAILLADESLLVSLLQSLPDVKPNITTGFPLTQSPIYGIMELWMDVQHLITHQKKTKIPYTYIETFINHPLTNVSKDEKYAIQQLIADKQLFEVDFKELTFKSSTLAHFFQPIIKIEEAIAVLIHLIDNLLANLAQEDRIKQIDSNLLIEVRKTLNQLHIGLETLQPLSIPFQFGLINKAIASINSAIEGNPLEGLQIMGLLESRCLNFDQVYVLGANEGILPKTSSSPTFIPNSLRQAYGLPILENQDALSAYLFYRHFQYSEGIHLLYNGIVSESSSGEESRFIKQLEFESKFQFINHHQQQNITFLPDQEELIIEKKGKIWDKLMRDYVENKKKISATALTTYLQSPLHFFLKHVAEIKEPPSITQEFEMNNLGTVIHNVMEKVYLPFKGVEKFVPIAELEKSLVVVDALIINEIIELYQLEGTGLHALNSLQRIMHKIAAEYVTLLIQHDIDHFIGIKIIELENDQDYVINFPIQIQGKEENISIYGIIDRVDEVLLKDKSVKTRIVDYKTGADEVNFKSLDKVFIKGTENKALVQTLFYTYVYEQVTGRNGIEPNLYVARKMREEGTLFYGRSEILEAEYLIAVKKEFQTFLKETLEEIFNPEIPFKHDPKAKIYDSDPYVLFYKNALNEEEIE
ncbi:PD-(D/E)XK nuclease family protein [Sphingobacterium sp. SRCM116780]|uniref:PD-(D/E)XK nuclease family protein n=1 Tax=Sphingobacterium sp. SRCM116780 TaxID=2907623 RepID=UPI001F2979FE|nr:PD-(D/E)XK nuclease family protein [Sphingobacterium sp. SRCM116780]UIR56129.1 PD-(D/E)XK nuclease family protein [Sphingobacterium sp. SRCM116780]